MEFLRSVCGKPKQIQRNCFGFPQTLRRNSICRKFHLPLSDRLILIAMQDFFLIFIVESSPEFEEFLDFLGDRVKLDNFSGFRGGLDVRSTSSSSRLTSPAKTTGTHSIYRIFHNNEIMFHVSTMLPFNPLDKQQVEYS